MTNKQTFTFTNPQKPNGRVDMEMLVHTMKTTVQLTEDGHASVHVHKSKSLLFDHK